MRFRVGVGIRHSGGWWWWGVVQGSSSSAAAFTLPPPPPALLVPIPSPPLLLFLYSTVSLPSPHVAYALISLPLYDQDVFSQ